MAAIIHVGLLILFLCCLFGRSDGVEGGKHLSEQEDLELEKQLKLLNKPAIKTIKTQYGEIYDCVDFFKQPAFDHPLLQNHSYHFQMKPQFPAMEVDETPSNETLLIGLRGGGCPVGTVPIKRITKEDLIREKFASKQIDFGGTIFAIARTKRAEALTGALGFITLYNPPVQEKQYSAARIKLQNGNDYIEFGWRVDRSFYGDSFTHLFIETNTNSAKMCIGVQCGFVVTRRDLSPGFVYPPSAMSTRGGKIFETKLRVQRDKDGNWWLSVGNNNAQVGFWPKKLFTGLSDFATYADWGGVVSSPHFVAAPPMGSGVKPVGDTRTDAYIRWITGVNIAGREVSVNTEPFINDAEKKYGVIDKISDESSFGHLVYFGGV